ncbi:hypothetical protein niasHT_030183 [Heterodera trifolii]|uniref:Uncharacterized protein n=1 Tax=Heterodera trifolii TaxID=157864 RepID=A0ABD2K2U4_9BILA
MLAPKLPPGEEKRHVNEGQDKQQQKKEHYGGRGKGGHVKRIRDLDCTGTVLCMALALCSVAFCAIGVAEWATFLPPDKFH